MIFTSYDDDKLRYYWKDKNFEADYNWLKAKLPGKEINFPSRTHDEQLWLISAASDTEPGETYLFDRKASDVDYWYVSRLPGDPTAGVADRHFHPAEPRTVRVTLTANY